MHTIDIAQSLRCPIAFPKVLQHTTRDFAHRLLAHPFLRRCGNGSVTMGELRRFLIQQGKYSRYFTRYLCALISQLDDSNDVLHLAANLVEELGYGADAHNTPHSHIYADMVASFGIQLEQHIVYPETQVLIDTMFMLCRQPGGIAGLGALCLGGEAIVPAIYARLIEGFLSCGVDIDQLQFFSIHVDCDDGHAETMYEIIARKTSNSISGRISAIQAGEIAINARLRFFDAISTEIQ
jgi:pyrroloquinoline quinone (PQQ) biosynthesis protein C